MKLNPQGTNIYRGPEPDHDSEAIDLLAKVAPKPTFGIKEAAAHTEWDRPQQPSDSSEIAPKLGRVALESDARLGIPTFATQDDLYLAYLEARIARNMSLSKEESDYLRKHYHETGGVTPQPMVAIDADRVQREREGEIVQSLLAAEAGRPSWDEFFFSMALLASTMATCPRAHCGAVIVRHKRVLSLGYNGVAEGVEHCPSEGEALSAHLALDHCRESVHAEVNALKNAIGNVYGATIYVYGHYRPCPPCQAELNRMGITDIRHRPGPRIGPDKNWG
jgi:dCMP deaminase